MKRFLLLAIAALAFVGCNEMFEDEGNSSLALSELPTLTAGFEDADTRTYVENNKYLRWHEGDLISAFVGDTKNVKYQFNGKTGDNSGTFVSVESSLGSSEKLDRIYALYPYDKSATITTKGVICCSLSAIQTYATNSFAQNVNTMVSATSGVNDGDIIFKNVGGYLKIRLYGEGTVKSIELRGNNGEKIAGNANITATYGGVPKIAMADDATESIILDCGDGVELSADAENPTEFWFVVPHTEFNKGITISVTNAYNAVFEKSTSNKIVVERNIIQPMSAVEVMLEEVAKPANNEIWYTATKKVVPKTDNVFGAVYLSSTYDPTSKKGILTFKGDVTTIGGSAFYDCDGLTSVTIPESVTTIGDSAFTYCESLTSVTIPDSVTTIGEAAFYSCSSLRSVTIPDSVTTIGDRAFRFCDGLTSVTIGDSVTTIGGSAFYDCSRLTSVTIGDSVTTIGEFAFGYCESLTSVTIPDSVTTIGEAAFLNCYSLTSVTIPDSVTSIGGGAFADCPLIKEFKGKFSADNGRCLIRDNTIIAYAEASGTEYTIPDSVTTIGYRAFDSCRSLTSVTIPDSVTTIGDMAFRWCESLTSATIGDSVTTIGDRAFSNCASLTSVTIPDSVTTIGERAFYACESLTSVTIPDSVTTIGGSAFEYCSRLTSVTIGDSVTTIGEKAFYKCVSLTSVYCKATTPPTMGGSVFANAPLEAIYVPTASVNDYKTAYGWRDYADYIIGYDFDKGEIATPKPANNEIWYTATEKVEPYYDDEFGATLLSNIYDPTTKEGVLTFDSDITQIGYEAFYDCNSLTSVTIPDSVTAIGERTFQSCDSLTSVTIGDSVTTIGDYAFNYCTSLTSVTIPDSVTTIGNHAFHHCENLTSVTIPDSVTTIGDAAFQYCFRLISITIPDSVTTIGERTFFECFRLTSVTIPDGVTTIGGGAFYQCNSLTSVTIPDSVTTIGVSAFYDCSNLTSVTIPDSVTTIGNSAFEGCSSLTSVTIGDSVTTIGENAFCYCSSLTSVTIGDSVTTIGGWAFYECEKLKYVYSKPTTPPSLGSYAFSGTNIRMVYVPSGCVEIYKQKWGYVCSNCEEYNFE